jgi:carbon-monoxide dehydrogenase medium subunit
VRLPPFTLHRPRSLEETAALLEQYGDEAVVYCGGTELLLLMKLGLARYSHLVDLKHIAVLQLLERHDGELRVGAAVTHRQLERSAVVRDAVPPLAEMARRVANIRVRSVGTLGGNLCFADPHSDPATFLLASGAQLICRRGNASRTLPMAEFLRGPYETSLRSGELLAEVRIPVLPQDAALVHMKFAVHERPALTVACFLRVEQQVISDARIAVGSVATLPVRVPEAERLLVGARPDVPHAVLRDAGEAAGDAVSPYADGNGSIEYKRELVRVFVRRCCGQAFAGLDPRKA